MRPTDHVDVSRVEPSARAYALQLFVEDYLTSAKIADLCHLDVMEVETLLDIYGGKAHRDRLRVSLEELRTEHGLPNARPERQKPPPVGKKLPPIEPPAEGPAPRGTGGRSRKWVPDGDGRYPCPHCEGVFDTPQGVGRHNATRHSPAVAAVGVVQEPVPAPPAVEEVDKHVEHVDAPVDEVEDAPASEEPAPAVQQEAVLLEAQQQRVLALKEAREVLEDRKGGSFLSTGTTELKVSAREVVAVADWIVTGVLPPEPVEPAPLPSSTTTTNERREA